MGVSSLTVPHTRPLPIRLRKWRRLPFQIGRALDPRPLPAVCPTGRSIPGR